MVQKSENLHRGCINSYEILWMIGKTTNLNWIAAFLNHQHYHAQSYFSGRRIQPTHVLTRICYHSVTWNILTKKTHPWTDRLITAVRIWDYKNRSSLYNPQNKKYKWIRNKWKKRHLVNLYLLCLCDHVHFAWILLHRVYCKSSPKHFGGANNSMRVCISITDFKQAQYKYQVPLDPKTT